jgi:hypothetical protein
MNDNDYQTQILVDATLPEAFRSILDVKKWWTQNLEGNSLKLNDVFTVRFDDLHVSTQKLIEVVPDQKIAWLVTDSRLNFISDKQEWTNTKICFELSENERKTQITFSHIGLHPGIECFNACSNAWSEYIHGSLFALINTGQGKPTPKIKT